ncbi:MAG: hypothetical protein H6Q90_4927 [Deltaproteobacteria bacterium]|nr:hypothetical protein [Deltaproteobacteria bacterium]
MRKMLFATVLAAAAIAGCSKSDKTQTSAAAEDNLPTMAVDDVDRALAANQVKAIDCNGDETRKRHGVVPGAILVSDEETFPASDLPADKATKLVFYCTGPG